MEKESRFLVHKKFWWGKSKKGGSDQTQTMLALRANKGMLINVHPYRTFRHRPVPEGTMREAFGFTGIFGVQAALDKGGYVYEGATVWAKYKKSEF